MDSFHAARDFLLTHRESYAQAYRDFRWPRLERFNWALDWFDPYARGNLRTALHIVEDDGPKRRLTFAEMAERSDRAANWLRSLGLRRGDRLLVMLPNGVPLWEIILAATKLAVVLVPAATQLTVNDLRERFERGGIRHVVAEAGVASKFEGVPGDYTRIAVNGTASGWHDYQATATAEPTFAPDGETRADDPLLLYFTSGTTSRPKLVLHTHQSYPVGHLSTMYWIGLREGDVHWNISSPGWAKHAWSNVFAPWNAGATVFVYNFARFDARRVLQALTDHEVSTLCAPPTVWRFLINVELGPRPQWLREAVSAGEPLNPEVIEKVRKAWGICAESRRWLTQLV